MSLSVRMVTYDNLTDVERDGVSNNGGGAEWASYIRVEHNGETTRLVSDAIEPEDATFNRDLSWVVGAIRQAYELGRADSNEQPA